MRSVSIVLALLCTLAACEEQAVQTDGKATVVSGDVGPGSGVVDGVTASSLFNRVCVDTAPSFAKAPAVLASLPFQQRPSTGTYFHRNLNLSFNLGGKGKPSKCSMVFASRDDASTVGIIVATNASNGRKIGVDAQSGIYTANGPGGTTMLFKPASTLGRDKYFHVVLSVDN